ncbi:hypothetical protein [Shewanella sp. SM74]|uniref:hypothetical protein n=1 Tax=Shewanella sp. SM74 TaxID=2912807 RepID=UPI0021D7DDE0|nr:hypothetical protein [Shewanella sp. SM74]MCU8011280.1 hypothetical protein [Shewanella sp. SM74]
MISSLKAHFTPRFVLFVMGVSLLLAGLDVVINRSNGTLVESDLLPTLPASTMRANTDPSHSSLLTDYASYDKEKAAEVEVTDSITPTEIGMSDSDQALQQGLISKLYIGDKIYRLDALVKRQQVSAVLKVTQVSATDANGEIVTLQLGDNLGPYSVVALNHKRLELSVGERRLWLALFTPQKINTEATP